MPDGPVIDAAIDERFFQRLPAAIALQLYLALLEF